LIFPETTIFEDPMVFPPLGLFYLRSALEQQGHEVDYVDMSEYIEEDGVRTKKYANPPSSGYDAYLVSGTTPQAREIRRLGKYLRERGCLTILGGPHATNYAGPITVTGKNPLPKTDAMPVDADILANYHVLIKGEGELTVHHALDRLPEAHDSMSRYGRGIVLSEASVLDLGTIPIPNRDAAKLYRYFLKDARGEEHRATTMFSSRGCPERCAFCDSPALWGRKVRYVPIPSVQRELEQIRELGFTGIHFFDDILPLARKRMVKIAELLKEFGFTWRCFIRVDIMSRPQYGKAFMQMMYDHGLREVLVGVESGDQRILDGIRKGTTVEQNTKIRQWCREIGIRFKASIILGLPGEDRESMEATLRWTLENKPDRVNICTYIPFPGTPISKEAELLRLGVIGSSGRTFDLNVEIDHTFLDGDYFYAGSRDKLQIVTSTSKLTRQELQDFWQYACNQVAAAGIPY
jgi:anaerobic magnesium-protoporphyrin IX monomethyl ester cyclase